MSGGVVVFSSREEEGATRASPRRAPVAGVTTDLLPASDEERSPSVWLRELIPPVAGVAALPERSSDLHATPGRVQKRSALLLSRASGRPRRQSAVQTADHKARRSYLGGHAMTGTIGARRAWTVSMISALSIPRV